MVHELEVLLGEIYKYEYVSVYCMYSRFGIVATAVLMFDTRDLVALKQANDSLPNLRMY